MGTTQQQREILLSFGELAVDETAVNTTCPFCHGGLSRDNSFSVTRKSEGYLYNCYRATCKARGFIPTILADTGNTPRRKFSPRHFREVLTQLPSEVKTYLMERFHLTSEELSTANCRWAPKVTRVVWPITNSNNRVVGHMTRGYKEFHNFEKGEPKAIAYWGNDCSKLYFPHTEVKDGPIVVVEDIISAIRVARHMRSVAMLGTIFNDNTVNELRQHSDSIWLGFDPDAVKLAIKAKQKYNAFFVDIRVIQFPDDPKDMGEEELREFLASK